ncbi:hypothetical protein N9L20_01910 [Flavobacteriaceae bacterium]|nr:hypothetical protein [Flavobacteriaceae bacterium]
MYTKNKYGLWSTINWSMKYVYFALGYSFIIFLFFRYLNIKLYIPWEPLTLIGIAVSFYVGFKNNNAYDRTWEARKIWGGIVNDSRSFGSEVLALIHEQGVPRSLIFRHIAWLKILQGQLRMDRTWEKPKTRLKQFSMFMDDQWRNAMVERLQPLLDQEDLDQILTAANPATQILNKQYQEIAKLELDSYSRLELMELLNHFFVGQGKSERIKNYPLPRQYASKSYWLTVIYIAILPFGFVSVVQDYTSFYWVSCLLSAGSIWIFLLMEHIGDTSENPFQAARTDVPITAISNGIEVDLLQMLKEPIPELDADMDGDYQI